MENHTGPQEDSGTATRPSPTVSVTLSGMDQEFVDLAANGDEDVARYLTTQVLLDRKYGYLTTGQRGSEKYLMQALRRNLAMGGDREFIAALERGVENLRNLRIERI